MPLALDLSALDALAKNDPVKIYKYAQLFMQSMEDILAQVDTAIDRNDMVALEAMGHRAKSTARNVGATELSDQCQRMETAANLRDGPAALAIAKSLRPAYASVQAAITQHIAS